MGSSGKSGGAGQQDNYYGTLAGALCIGPVKALVAIILGGKYFYQPETPLLRTGVGVGDYYEIVDTRPGARSGKLRFYWGSETQFADSALVALRPDTPPFRGVCYFVLDEFLFGTGVGTAPNLEFILQREPLQALVTGDAAELDANDQANPVAAAAEVLSAWHGLNLSASGIDGDAFQDLADAIDGDAVVRELSVCSPLWSAQAAARSLLLDLGAPGDLWFRLGASGRVECGRWREAGPSVSISTLDANALTAEIELAAQAVDELPTAIGVDFADRAYAYADSSEKVDDLALLRQQGQPSNKKLSRKQVTRRQQARAQGAAELRRAGRVILRGTIKVRRARAVNPDGSPIRPGDWFRLDVDPEPGGAGVVLLCRCTGRLASPTGPIGLEWETDPGAVPEAYLPSYEITEPTPEMVGPLEFYRVFSLPTEEASGGSDEAPRISVVALRPEATWQSIEVFYSDAADGEYVSIGTQAGFACPATLVTSVDSTDGRIRVATVATFSGYAGTQDGTLDASLLREATGSGTDVAARNDELVLVLVRKSGTGAIFASGNLDWLEVCSVIDVTPVSAGVYDVDVIRGRMGTRPLDFDTVGSTVSFPAAWATYEVWCLPKGRLARLEHADFASLLAGQVPGHYRFAAASRAEVYDPATAEAEGLQADGDWHPQVEYLFPAGGEKTPRIAVTSPVSSAQISTSGLMTLDFEVLDNQDDIAEVVAWSEVDGTGASYTEHVRRYVPLAGLFAFSEEVTIPAVEGNHRVVVQARDLRGHLVQAERTVFRFTSSTPVPPPEISWFGKGVFTGTTAASIYGASPSGTKLLFRVRLPGGIDYGAVPHTLQIRKTGVSTWITFAATGWFGFYVSGRVYSAWASFTNFALLNNQSYQFRVRRDGDGHVSPTETLAWSTWVNASSLLF